MLTSNAAESHSTEYGQAPRYWVHHQKGVFQGGRVARIFPATCSVVGWNAQSAVAGAAGQSSAVPKLRYAPPPPLTTWATLSRPPASPRSA